MEAASRWAAEAKWRPRASAQATPPASRNPTGLRPMAQLGEPCSTTSLLNSLSSPEGETLRTKRVMAVPAPQA